MENPNIVPAPGAPAAAHKYAGFWIRFLAAIIDGIIINILTVIIVSLVSGNFSFSPTDRPDLITPGWQSLLPSVYVLAFWIWKSATPGKMILGLKIIQEDGGPLTPARAVGRYFAQIPSAIVFGLGYLWVAFDKRKQGWHDKLAKTLVVKQ